MEYDKWIPGEGLNLSVNDPYKNFTDTALLKEYLGSYEFIDNTSVELQIDKNQKSLVLLNEGRVYPLFYKDKDLFTVPEEQTVTFERDSNQQIIGFKISHKDDTLFKKIN